MVNNAWSMDHDPRLKDRGQKSLSIAINPGVYISHFGMIQTQYKTKTKTSFVWVATGLGSDRSWSMGRDGLRRVLVHGLRRVLAHADAGVGIGMLKRGFKKLFKKTMNSPIRPLISRK